MTRGNQREKRREQVQKLAASKSKNAKSGTELQRSKESAAEIMRAKQAAAEEKKSKDGPNK